MTLADILALAWKAGRDGRKPELLAVEELEGLAVAERVRVPTPERWRREQAKRQWRRLRGGRYSLRKKAGLVGVDHRTVAAWEKTESGEQDS